MSAQSLSLSVKMFLHHCQSSLGTIRNIQKTFFPDKTTVLNAALQLVDPYIFTLPSDSSCFYILCYHPVCKNQPTCPTSPGSIQDKKHTHAQVGLEWLGMVRTANTQVLGRAFQVIEPFWSALFVQSGCFHELSSAHLQLVENTIQKKPKTTHDIERQQGTG